MDEEEVAAGARVAGVELQDLLKAPQGLADPAYDPQILAVDASDTMGTATPWDDQVASYSAGAASCSSACRAPDVIAPGNLSDADASVWTFHLRKGVRFHDDACFADGKGRELPSPDGEAVEAAKELEVGHVKGAVRHHEPAFETERQVIA